MGVFKKFQYIILYFIGFALIGGTSLLQSGLGWKGLLDLSFYIDILLTNLAIIFCVLATLFKIIGEFKSKNKEYVSSLDNISVFARNKYKPTIFARYTKYINLQRKKIQFEYNVNRKIYELEKKAGEEIVFMWINNEKPKEINKKNSIINRINQKIKNKKFENFKKKREFLEKQLKKDWVDKNLEKTYVKYDKVTADIVIGGYYNKKNNQFENDFIVKNKGWKIAKDRLPMMLFGTGVVCFISSIAFTIVFDWDAIMPILSKLLILIWQAILTIKYADDFCNSIILKDIRFRNGIVNEYDSWVLQELKRTQKTGDLQIEVDK
jgi:hypothetical protein